MNSTENFIMSQSILFLDDAIVIYLLLSYVRPLVCFPDSFHYFYLFPKDPSRKYLTLYPF